MIEERRRPDDPQEMSVGSLLESVRNGIRIVTSVIGIVALFAGFYLAIKMFNLIYEGLANPQGLAPLIAKWAEAIGGKDLTLVFGDQSLDVARAFAVVILGGGTVLLAWLAIGVMASGARIIAWTAGEKEAVKRILADAFAALRKPPPADGPA